MQLGGSRKTLGKTLSLNKIGINLQNGARPFAGNWKWLTWFVYLGMLPGSWRHFWDQSPGSCSKIASTSLNNFQKDESEGTVDGRNPANHLGCQKTTVNNGINNYQPQLVRRIFWTINSIMDKSKYMSVFLESQKLATKLKFHPFQLFGNRVSWRCPWGNRIHQDIFFFAKCDPTDF